MDTIFNLDYTGFVPLLLRCAAFIAAGLLLGYCCFFGLSKLLFRKRKQHKDNALRLSRFWAFAMLMGLLALYVYLLIKHVGFGNIAWTKWATFLGLLPFLLLYLLVIGVFLIDYYNYRKKLKDTKII